MTEVPDWIDSAAEEIAGDPNCCDISSSGSDAMAAIIRKHFDGAHGRPETDALDFPARDFAAVHAHPSAERISAKGLDELAATLREPLTMGLTSDPCRALVAEVRRLRSLIRATGVPSDSLAPSCPNDQGECWWCTASVGGRGVQHDTGCPWPEIEAEIETQREDEKA